ncbi:MAG: hypothetical protein II736_08010, partial [Clostridia bacterium]|nr:hypothetical protein [Clostridia bacterium]
TFVRAAALCLVLLCALATSACSHSTVYGETVTPTAAPEQVPATEEKTTEPPETEAPEVKTVRATVTAGGVTVSFDLPEGWSFEEDKEFERTYDGAISFFPEETPGKKITVGYREEPIGFCGTCLTTEEITLGGIKGTKMIYSDMRDYPWDSIILGKVYILNRGFTNDQWAVCGDEIMAILDTITVTEG